MALNPSSIDRLPKSTRSIWKNQRAGIFNNSKILSKMAEYSICSSVECCVKEHWNCAPGECKKLPCTLCGEGFNRVNRAFAHIDLHHYENPTAMIESSSLVVFFICSSK